MTRKAIVFKNRKSEILFCVYTVSKLSDLEFLLLIKQCFTIFEGKKYDNFSSFHEFTDSIPILTEISKRLNERKITHTLVPFDWVSDYDSIVYLLVAQSLLMAKEYEITWKEFYEYVLTKKVKGNPYRFVSSTLNKSKFNKSDFYALGNNDSNSHARISQINENDILIENPYMSYPYEERIFGFDTNK